MNSFVRRAFAASCAMALVFSLALPAAADYSSFEAVTSHVNLKVPQTLQITKPAEDITVSSPYYYIMGSSDPGQPLYMGNNNYEITTRGKQGSFGVYVALAYGKNLVKFNQGNETVSVYITRSDTPSALAQATTVSSMFPSYNNAYFVNDKVSLSCVAPSGATVTATVKSRTITLKQVAATAQAGIAARFRGEYIMPDADGTVSLGNVTYTMTYQGKTVTKTSAGELITTGVGDALTVQCTQVSAAVIKEPNGAYIATAKLGAVDNVIGGNDSYYQLSMGGWISRANVAPLVGKYSIKNPISSVSFTPESTSEVFTFSGPVSAIAQSWQTDNKLVVRLFNTSGLSEFSTAESKLFSGSTVTANADGSTTIELLLKPGATLWGHAVQYINGGIQVICKYRPVLSGDVNKPLTGITVALDAGHGSVDPGALGIAQLTGPTESAINRATAEAVKIQLEAMGATVLLPSQLDLNSRFNERMQPAISERADLFISLHCNATAANANGGNATGIELYYYEGIGKKLGESLMSTMTAYTGRANRGVRYYAFRVTLNSLAPSVLMEMGYMTNPSDYDSLCSKEGVYQTAQAVGDGVLNLLKA
ncbi:N-acetylmuramoyl-L-alanine amidase [Oscillospiraceae bacterium LTW-04]|nr:N-acetylmuramoyl-L-alanine amidase [Oscillospiraceae bacterium MB24-C1]